MANITVIGAGYVGLVTGACFAELGHNVTLLEIDANRLDALKREELPVSEPGLPELWQRNRTQGRLRATDDYGKGLMGADFAFIAVGTPSTSNGHPDLKWLRLAAKNIAQKASGPMTVVIKSTVPIGAADLVARILARDGQGKYALPVISNPEFLREGAAVYDFMHPIRVVVGGLDKDAADAVARLYSSLNPQTIMCDGRTAEMSKYASNVFLATRISFINEIAGLCEAYGVDVVQVERVVGSEPRIGNGYLRAGLGWGGSCLPKDVRGLLQMAKSQRVPLTLLKTVKRVNERQPLLIIGKLQGLLGDLNGKTIGILGLSFKPNTNDMREACSIPIISALTELGCRLKAYDPLAMPTAAKILPQLTYCANAYEVARDSDALILVTEWDEFKELDMRSIASLMAYPVLVDSQNFYDPHEMLQIGFQYEGVGRRTATNEQPQTGLTKVGGSSNRR